MKRPLRFGLFQASYSTPDMVRVGVAAEQHGFDSVLIGDHFLDLSGIIKVDPWMVLATIGSKTKKIRLTTHVTDVLRTHPAKLAHIAATLDELTGGRVTLGLGAGESMNLVPFGIGFGETPVERIAKLREGMQVIRALLESDRDHKVNFEGRFFSMDDAWLQQRPVQKPLPIGVGALGSRLGLELVGEASDEWLPAYNTLELFKERIRVIKESAARYGRRPGSIRYNASILAVMTKDRAVMQKAVDAYRGSILSLAPRLVKRMVGRSSRIKLDLGYDYQDRVIPENPVIERMSGSIRNVPDSVVRDFMVIGTADDLVEAIDSYRKAGATGIILWDMVAEGMYNSIPLAVKNLKLVEQKVMPHFR